MGTDQSIGAHFVERKKEGAPIIFDRGDQSIAAINRSRRSTA